MARRFVTEDAVENLAEREGHEIVAGFRISEWHPLENAPPCEVCVPGAHGH